MPKKKQKHNPNLIREKHAYSLAEMADVLKIHIRTAQSWRKQGLKPIDDTSWPLYFMGAEIKQFLSEKAHKRRHKLGPDEFFCPKCKGPRKSRPDSMSIELTNKRLGKLYKQAIIKGVCAICGQDLFRFSSDRKVKEMRENIPQLVERSKYLYGSDDSPINTD